MADPIKTLSLPARKSPRQANVANKIAETVDIAAWYERHEHLTHRLVHMMSRGRRNIAVEFSAEDAKLIDDAYTALRAHAKFLARDSLPLLLTRDGKHTIPFDRLTEARAKVHALTFELSEARAAAAHATGIATQHPDKHPTELPAPVATVRSWSPNLHNRGLTRTYKVEWHQHDLGADTRLFTEAQLRTVVTQALRSTQNQGGNQ